MSSKLVDKSETGKIFSMIAFTQSVIPMIAAPAVTAVFNATLVLDSGVAFYGLAALNLPAMALSLYLDLLLRKMPALNK